MSSIVSAITGTGSQGSLQAQQANILNPSTVAQANQQYNTANNALNQQQSFVNAVNAANGVGNQSQVFNQLQGVANGTGPNPALAQLNQTTGQNVAAQNALMAGQRGSSQNVGLIARQAAMQGANLQQQAVGQGATMAANQQLNAINSSGQLATNQANQQANAISGLNSAAQGEQGQILNSIAGQNSAAVGSQQSINSANSALEQQNAKGAMDLFGNLTGAAGSAVAMAGGGMIPHFADGGQNGTYLPNTGPSPFDAPAPQNISQPTSASTPLATPAKSNPSGPKSGVANYFAGSNPQQLTGMSAAGNGLGTLIGQGIKSLFSSSTTPTQGNAGSGTGGAADLNSVTGQSGAADSFQPSNLAQSTSAQAAWNTAMTSPNDQGGNQFAKGGKVPALVSPGEVYLDPKDVKEVKKGKDPIKTGKKIPGKPKFPGNDYRNDVVPKKLDEGGIVIPNKILQGKNPHWEAMRFVHQTLRKGK